MLIVNTDGTLAERSGNGLTIFSQWLVDTGRANCPDAFFLRVYHDAPGSPFVGAPIEAGNARGIKGFGSTWASRHTDFRPLGSARTPWGFRF